MHDIGIAAGGSPYSFPGMTVIVSTVTAFEDDARGESFDVEFPRRRQSLIEIIYVEYHAALR